MAAKYEKPAAKGAALPGKKTFCLNMTLFVDQNGTEIILEVVRYLHTNSAFYAAGGCLLLQQKARTNPVFSFCNHAPVML